MKKTLQSIWLALVLALLPAWAGIARAADEPVKVVYHLTEGVQQASRAIGNIRNHLNADPTAKIVVVTHGPGIDFLLDGAESAQGGKFAGPIGELANRGVEFRVCNNTLVTRKINKDQVVMEAQGRALGRGRGGAVAGARRVCVPAALIRVAPAALRAAPLPGHWRSALMELGRPVDRSARRPPTSPAAWPRR